MALFSKANLMKAGVLFIVFAFMFELFAFGGGGGQPAEEELFDPGVTGTAPVSGIAIVEGMVVSYDRELYIFGIDEEAGAVVEALQGEGVVQYVAPGPEDSTVLNLGRSANVSEVAARFDGTNATVAARARLKMPTLINFTTNQGDVSAIFQDTVTIDLAPDIPVGGNISVRITANIVDAAVASYVVDPISLVISFRAQATVVGYEPSHLIMATVAWEDREFDEEAVRQGFLELYPEGTFSVERNSSESVDAEFPDSMMVLMFDAEEADVSFMEGIVEYTDLVDYRQATLDLPESVEFNNESVELKQRTLVAIILEEPVGTVLELNLKGDLFAGKVSNVELEE